MKDLIAPLAVFVVGLSVFVYVNIPHVEPSPLEQWTPDLAEAQYEGAKYGRWGERIISLEGSPCEIHRVRYRGVYYVANTCGGLIIEPTERRRL